jgi:hypothetical protein
MDARRSFYLGPKQDDFAEFAAEPNRPKDVDIPYATPSNDNVPARRSPFQPVASEIIAKLLKAGYLQPPAHNHADAITNAISQMKQDLRGRGGRDNGPRAA